jgi:hypothetical protein
MTIIPRTAKKGVNVPIGMSQSASKTKAIYIPGAKSFRKYSLREETLLKS